jgi:hypothetical protein
LIRARTGDGMAFLRTDIIRALDELIANEAGSAFQALAVVLAKQKWPDLIASEWHNDGGLDAYAPASLADGKKAKGVASSVTCTLRKVKSDAETAKENYKDLEVLIFVTPHKVTAATANGWADEVRKAYGLELYVMSREDIITSLILPSNAARCGMLPGITVPVENDVADLMAKVRAAVAEEAETWRVRQRMIDRPIIPLNAVKLDSAGKETSNTLDIEGLLTALRESRRIALEAPGGGGKTTTLVQLATQPARDSELSFLIDLPAWIRSGTDVLDFVARGTPFRARNISAVDLARLAERVHFSFLLNGWNEIAEFYSGSAITALAELERNFPAAGIVVATRTHYISPPLPGAIRAKLLRFTRRQRAYYLRQTLGDRAEELRLHLVSSRVLDELTRTPLILAEVVTIFESGNPVPSTRVGVLGAVMKLFEGIPLHRPHLQAPPLSNKGERYLTHLAAGMTARGEVLTFEVDARVMLQSASAAALHATHEISTPLSPDDLLQALTAHHVLEQIDYPSVAYRFQHQQFQEFYAARFLADALMALASGNDEAAGKAFAASYINKPMWEEPLHMVAEEISLATEDSSRRATALKEGVRLIELTLPVDPILAADLARLAGPMVWTAVRNQIGAVLRDWLSIGDPRHHRLALAAVLATGSNDFADILVPLLSAEDRELRISTYEAGEAFYPTSLGANWRSVVAGWHEGARADFVSEVTHRGLMADIAEDFATNDPSTKVREQAIQELSWISASDALERIANSLDDDALDTLLPALFPEVLPESLRPRFIAANRRLIAREATPLGRIRQLLKGIEFGDEAVATDLIAELTALSPPVDQYAEYAIREALRIVEPHNAVWVSEWLSAKVLDGTLWQEHWKPFLLPPSEKSASDLIHKVAARELEYREASATRMILSVGATPELVTQVFDKLCDLQRAMSAGDTQPLVRACISQLREILRSIPVDVAVAGIIPSLQGDFDGDKFRAVTVIFGQVNADAEELRGAMPEALRQPLRRYLKEGITQLLAEDLFDDSTRSDAAMSLGRIGDAEDLVDLERMIDADIARSKGSTDYSNWYVRAVLWLDAPGTDASLIALLRQDKYVFQAARGLLQLAVPPNREKSFVGNTTNFEAIWTARSGARPPGFDPARAKRSAEAMKQRMAELKRENEVKLEASIYRIKELAVLVATLDGRDSADCVISALALPGQRGWDAFVRVNGIRALLMSGATLRLDSMQSVLQPAIEYTLSQGLYQGQNLSLLVDCLVFILLSDNPVRAIAYIKEVMTKFRYRPYQFRDLVTAVGHTRSDTAVPFLIGFARGEGGVQNMEDAWIEALGRLNMVSSRQALLSFVDPDIPWVGVTINFDYRNTEIFAAFVAGWAQQDPALNQRLLALSQLNLTPTQLQLLSAIYRQMGSDDVIVAGANLLQGTMSPLGSNGGLETQFLERQPHGRSGAFVLVARNAQKARAELFQAVLNDPRRTDLFWPGVFQPAALGSMRQV